jgi:glycosyltransferase involved in cell wall biosynthesis
MTMPFRNEVETPATNGSGRTAVDISVVVPVYNEEGSLPELFGELDAALSSTGLRYELIFVDDGSRDRSFELLRERAELDPAVVAIRFRRNFGQTAALQCGLDHARGQVIALMDADLQNDPRDIPMMLAKLDEGHDLVAGWRADRKDKFLSRRLPSIVANWIIGRATGVRLHDYGCTLKVMRAELGKELKLYGEMHRFIPALAAVIGAQIVETKVNHRPRVYGVSKYGIGRTLRVILDLTTVRFMQQFMVRPMQVFGLMGLVCLLLGLAICALLAFLKIFYGATLADRPLLLLGVLLIVVGVQLLSLGLVADLAARTYFESQGRPPYYVRSVVRGRADDALAAQPLTQSRMDQEVVGAD